jgi:hypothetical protein
VRSLRKEYGNAANQVIEKVTLSRTRSGSDSGDAETGDRTAEDQHQLRRDGPGTDPQGSGPKVESAQQSRSLFDAATSDEVAETAARDRDQLEGERLTAQLNAPLTREEQLKKLKRSKDKPQTSLSMTTNRRRRKDR